MKGAQRKWVPKEGQSSKRGIIGNYMMYTFKNVDLQAALNTDYEYIYDKGFLIFFAKGFLILVSHHCVKLAIE